MPSLKNVVVFTYYWPPAGGVAVQRWLKFSKYLPENGWQPIIVTVKDGSYPYTDLSLQKEVLPTIEVHRTKTLEPFTWYNWLRGKKGKQLPTALLDSTAPKSLFQQLAEFIRANFFIPDARKGWVKYAVAEGAKMIRSKKIDAIVTTGPPHSSHLIGCTLQKQFGVKWLADFRDPWTGIFTNHYLPRTHWAKVRDKKLEEMVLKQADAVSVIGPSMKKDFEHLAKKIEIIWNGFDEADTANLLTVHHNDVFTIRYVGNLFASQQIPAFWKAVKRLVEQENAALKIELIGRVDESVKTLIAQYQLANLVTYSDFVSHQEAVDLMCRADALLFAIPQVPGNERILTGKIFEYLAARKPILAFGNVQGDAAELLRECGREAMCAFDDDENAFQQLKKCYHCFCSKQPPNYSDAFKKFSRRNQTKALAQFLEEL
jgi:glycosyltransferase involved in cell wall biosynthesis